MAMVSLIRTRKISFVKQVFMDALGSVANKSGTSDYKDNAPLSYAPRVVGLSEGGIL